MNINFTLFEDAMSVYNQTKEDIHEDNNTKCLHSDIIYENDITSCLECGEQLNRHIMHEKEWRFYGSSDSKRVTDPNRVQVRKSDERSINKDVENMGFSESIVSNANTIYVQVTNGQIFRGDSRKAVVFACIYHAYKIVGMSQTPKNLMETFGIDKKNSLKGLKIVNVNTPKDSPIHSMSITAIHHIYDVMNKFSATTTQKDEVIKLYSDTKNKSSKLNRARPQSVSASLIYYWILVNKIDISLKKFAQKVSLSELTINKNIKEIAKIMKNDTIW